MYGTEDVTTNAIVPAGHRSRAKIVAKAHGVLAGQGLRERGLHGLDRDIAYRETMKAVMTVSPGDVSSATLEGATRANTDRRTGGPQHSPETSGSPR
jgi:nicotinate-nucleotide pyrophosphorylase (carboxylating)